MVIAKNTIGVQDSSAESASKALQILEAVLLARYSNKKMEKLAKQNKGGAFFISTAGHELVGVVCAKALIPGKDWGLPYYRDYGFPIGIGCDLIELFGFFLARNTINHGSGRVMSFHYSQRDLRLMPHSSPVGSQFLQAAGRAYAVKQSGKDEVVYVSGGDGSTSQGDFHEALNFSSIHQLPVIFVIQNNEWAISVPLKEQTAGKSIVPMAKGYAGLTVSEVDGTNYLALTEVMEEAVKKGRSGNGPTLIVANVPRLGAHSSSDDQKKYRSSKDLEENLKRDPLDLYIQFLLKNQILIQNEIDLVKKNVLEELEKAAHEAEAIPHPDPKTVNDHIFNKKVHKTVTCEAEYKEGNEIVIMDAINHALQEEMEKDPNILLFGQDIAHGKGGVFGITRNLTTRFGSTRCFNTPLAESTIMGLALGISCDGKYKAVAEMQFADYMWTGINQLINETAGFHWRSNGQWDCSLVLRLPYGGYIQGGPYHSQSPEAYLTHTPGLKVVVPSNAKDAKGLMKSAIRDPNPVMFLEHKALYRQRVFCARNEPSHDYLAPIGKASIVRFGEDMTIIAWGMMLVMAHEVTERFSKEDYSVELIDLCTLIPLDMETILTSVKKTGKLMIIHEAPKNGGFAAEISARIMEQAFEYLDAPVSRVCGLNTPVPFSKPLENAVLPQKEDIEKSIRELYQY